MQDSDRRPICAGKNGGTSMRRHQGRRAGPKLSPVQQDAWRERDQDVVAGTIWLHGQAAADLVALHHEPGRACQAAATCCRGRVALYRCGVEVGDGQRFLHLERPRPSEVIKAMALIGFRGGEARTGKLGCEHLMREQRRE